MTGAARLRGAILERLRTETRAEHDAIERDLGWEGRVDSPDRYRALLVRLHAFHLWWEPAVAVQVGDRAFTDPRRKVALLERDLRHLGLSAADLAALPRPTAGLAFADEAEALGSMYVLEGSTLGGQIIARRVREMLGFEPRYHGSYGREVGPMWRAFQARLTERIAPERADAAVDAARRTFALLRLRLA